MYGMTTLQPAELQVTTRRNAGPQRYRQRFTIVVLSLSALLSACGGGGGGGPAATYSVGGTISGLASGQSVVLQNNGGDNLTISSNGSFTFPTQLAGGAPYAVTVKTPPTGVACTVSAGNNSIGSNNVTNVAVTCAGITFTIGGTVSGLASGEQLMLTDTFFSTINQQHPVDPQVDSVTITGGGSGAFQFPTPVPYGGTYDVTIAAQPSTQTCTLTNGLGSGNGLTNNVTNIAVNCVAATVSLVYSFRGASVDGEIPTSLIQAADGYFYGPMSGGSSGNGAIFKVSAAGVENMLYSFGGGTTDGSDPGALIQGSDGNFYGTTQRGGTNNLGTVFKLTPSGVESVLYSFAGGATDGAVPNAPLVQGSDGSFYGTTLQGGPGVSTLGTVFKIAPGGVESVLHFFSGGTADGSSPVGLILGKDGNLYGTTSSGGANGFGTAFKITTAGAESVLYSFIESGVSVPSPLLQATDGNFYGTIGTGNGAAFGEVYGEVFQLTPAGLFTPIYVIPGVVTNQGNPNSPLLQASDGNLYWTTYGVLLAPSLPSYGSIFRVSLTGVGSLVYSFTSGPADGASPFGGLIQGSDGNLYGTTEQGGANEDGTVYRVYASALNPL